MIDFFYHKLNNNNNNNNNHNYNNNHNNNKLISPNSNKIKDYKFLNHYFLL